MLGEEVAELLIRFVGERFLAGDARRELDLDTPLLEWGVLTSLNTTALLHFIRTEIGVEIPPIRITGEGFRSVRSITAMIGELSSAPSVPAGRTSSEHRAEGQA